MTDLEYGRAWAEQQGKRPRHLGASVRPDDLWLWYADGGGGTPDPAATLPWFLLRTCTTGTGVYRTEDEAYTALGAAVRTIHAAVPHLRPDHG